MGGSRWPVAPAGAWLWGKLVVTTTTMTRDVPWLCPSPEHPGEMSSSSSAWTDQGGWKSSTHVALPSNDTQVALRTFPELGWFSRPSYGQHVHSQGKGALQQRKSVQETSPKTSLTATLPPHSIPAPLRPMPSAASGAPDESDCGLDGDEGDAHVSGHSKPVSAPWRVIMKFSTGLEPACGYCCYCGLEKAKINVII